MQRVTISPTLTVRQAMRAMDESAERILFIAEADRLLGVLTDGDIRRWILNNRGLEEPVTGVMNPHPKTIREGHTIEEARDLMLAVRKECLPVLSADDRLVSAVWWMDIFEFEAHEHEKIDLPVVVMGGGQGTRLSPITKVLPKPLMPVGETPIIELIAERFVKAGCHRFYLSLNYKADLIKAYFADQVRDFSIDYVVEDRPLGTAGSLLLLRDRLEGPFFVSNCDVLVEANYADVYKFHCEQGSAITLVGSMKHFVIPYGVCDIGENGTLATIREKPEYSFLVSTGLSLLEPDVLELIPPGEMYHMTDLVNDATDAGMKVSVYPVSEKAWLDVGQWEELQETLRRFQAT